MKAEEELLDIKEPKYAVIDENGKRIAIFRYKLSADQSLSRLRLNKREILKVVKI